MSVTNPSERQATFCATLVDEWVRGGVTHAVLCPGSRSTPLALALAGRPELALHVRLDERGAGFFAVGLAVASGRPTVLVTTSGTAAVELHPAVVEADQGGVPLVVATADRPPELHDVGAPQTIDQSRLYADAVRWSFTPGSAVAFPETAWRSLGARALAEATKGPLGPGPVHLNLSFAEPLVGVPGPLPAGRPDGQPWHQTVRERSGRSVLMGLVRRWPGRRGVVVAGAGAGPPEQVLALSERLGFPVLADPRSGCRVAHDDVVAAADAFLRQDDVAAALRPEVVLHLGSPWQSKVLGAFVADAAAAGAEVVGVDPYWRWADPERLVTTHHATDPGDWTRFAIGLLHDVVDPGEWQTRWRTTEAAAQRAIDEVLAGEAETGSGLSEPGVARWLPGALPEGTTVLAAASMPGRDLEWYAPPLAAPPVVRANRGVNGIDGLVATAQGLAEGGEGPVVALLGDLAFLHDVSSLVRPLGAKERGSCTLLVVDNGGGGIFSFLPQAGAVDPVRFELLFATPQAPDVVEVARGFGLPAFDVTRVDELAPTMEKVVGREPLAVVRARVLDHAANVELHERLHAAVAAAVTGVQR
ncbi:MAG TPA: 2-succinyl-5-enolpyruvyl-6-hydroxy-3-cyclohexene-1-carboxylic-acid synthase [Acidimicrobiales bacterium]|nr:2-succinyl-5-enolpyruvyl-6-hydroxy-3-cyclohexene-1-carboxylic-acid synthase [Acidimicrobiales bacterium]